jgi:PX domain
MSIINKGEVLMSVIADLRNVICALRLFLKFGSLFLYILCQIGGGDILLFFQTNLPVFKLKDSTVRRRYSDFEWLRNELERDSKVDLVMGRRIKNFNSADFGFLDRGSQFTQ